jgi:hypothetical protein
VSAARSRSQTSRGPFSHESIPDRQEFEQLALESLGHLDVRQVHGRQHDQLRARNGGGYLLTVLGSRYGVVLPANYERRELNSPTPDNKATSPFSIDTSIRMSRLPVKMEPSIRRRTWWMAPVRSREESIQQ